MTRRLLRRAGPSLVLVWALALGAGPVHGGQDAASPEEPAGSPLGRDPSGATYADETARALHTAAMENRERLDDSLVRYTAVVRRRIGAGLRTPLKDRTLYRMEAAHRIFWSRDGDRLVQILALRQQLPVDIEELEDVEEDVLDLFDESFDPMNDRLLFGIASDEDDFGDPDDEDFWFGHPLYREYVGGYRFATGDTLRLSLPDGRAIEAIELQVVPHEANVHLMTGSLWIEPRSGNLVRAVYRLSDTFDALRDIADLREEEEEDLRYVPGFLKPWTAEISIIAVDYSLWDFDVWMPRSMRIEGVVSAGILRMPATYDLSYEVESVTTEASLAAGPDPSVPEVRFETRREAMAYLAELAFGGEVPYVPNGDRVIDRGRETRFLVPADPAFLAESPELPPPIWDDAPGFASGDEIRSLYDGLADLPAPQLVAVPATLRWGLQRSDLIRYNRVEGLSVAARGQVRPPSFLGPLTVEATVRVGAADQKPNVRLGVAREALRSRVVLSAYHELAAVEEGARHLGFGNSLMAFFFGRDDGDYFRRSGASLEWSPPSAERRTFLVRGYAEHHGAAVRETDFNLFRFWARDFVFRPNLLAAEGWEYGGLVQLSPWWGTDPDMVQGGVELTGRAALGDFEHAQASAVGRLAVPLPSRLRLGLEAGAGTSWGTPSAQRLWSVGGPQTLRGYGPRVAIGTGFARGRAELARRVRFGAVSLFWDVGWAGERDGRWLEDPFHSLGAGVSLLDGLIRLDGAQGLRSPGGFRLDLYLDALL